MFRTVLKKEFLDHVLDARFGVSVVLCLLLTIISVMVLVGDYAARRDDFHRNTSAFKAEAQRQNGYLELARNGMKVDRPPAKLQIPAYGLEKDPDRTAKVPAQGIPKVFRELYANPLLSLFPVADMVFVVATVLSLLAFVISYDAVTSEREEETIKLLMSYNVPRDKLILAKWLGGYVSLAIPFLLSAGIGCVVILLANIDLSAGDWMAFGTMIGVSLLFLAATFSVGLFVSCVSKHSATSITVLILVWVLFVLIAPNVSPYAAARVAQVRPFSIVESEIRVETGDHMRTFFKKMNEHRREFMLAFRMGGQKAEQAGQKLLELLNEARVQLQDDIGKMEQAKLKEFRRGQSRQIAVTKNISRVSPIAAYVYAATDIASTGVRKREHYYQSLQEYQRQFAEYVEDKIRRTGGRVFLDLFIGAEDYDISDMPVFSYREEAFPRRIEYSVWDTVVLAGYAVGFFLGSFVWFRKMELV